MNYKPVFVGVLILTAVLLAACDVVDSLTDDSETSSSLTPEPYSALATVIATGTPIDAMDSGLPLPIQEALAIGGSPTKQPAAGTPEAVYSDSNAEICSDATSGKSLSYQQALDIAAGSACTAAGNLLPAHFCSRNTGAWWIGLHIQKEGCNPVCVIDVNSHSAEVNWRCSGVAAPTAETAQPQQVTDADEQGVSDFEQFSEWRGIIYRQPHGALVAYRFLRDDGQWFDLGTGQGDIRQQFASAAWTSAKVILSGELTAVPGSLNIQNLAQLNTRSSEARNLTDFAMATSSSQLSNDDRGTYQAWSAVDGTLQQPWCEGVGGPGGGEWLQLDFSGPLQVTAIRLANGYQSGDYLYMLNNRVQSASILLDNRPLAGWNLLDTRDWQAYPVAGDGASGVVANSVRLVIEDTIAGWEFDDTCIAEIEVWGIPAE